MPPPQRNDATESAWRRRLNVGISGSGLERSEVGGRRVWGRGNDWSWWSIIRRRIRISTECLRGGRFMPALSLFPVLFVFVSCVVPLSTPSSTHDTVSTTTTTTTSTTTTPTTTSTKPTTITTTPPQGNGSTFPNNSSGDKGSSAAPYSDSEPGFAPIICPAARKWVETRGSFCFTLRESTFLKNATELQRREQRAIDMFCEIENILEKVDCTQPYSVNVHRNQCWLCREAYRDWVCAMTTDTLEDGRVDCDGGVMPCPSCASICHQVMRLCPYLTPDRVQFDEIGNQTSHVSQYGGHPAFYCPLENIHASDPAYSSDCSKTQMMREDPDYVHNLCAADARFMSKRSIYEDSSHVVVVGEGDDVREEMSGGGNGGIPGDAAGRFTVTHYSSCCWTYASSLIDKSQEFEDNMQAYKSMLTNNRVKLNCCNSNGECVPSDPDGLNVSTTAPSSTNGSLVDGEEEEDKRDVPMTRQQRSGGVAGSNLRTANNQVRGEDGKFRELSNAYMHDESNIDEEEEEDDEEYYDDSSAGEIYSSGGSSNEHASSSSSSSTSSSSSSSSSSTQAYGRGRLYESSSSVISNHRDNKIYVTRESRSVHEPFYMYDEGSSSGGGSSGGCSSYLHVVAWSWVVGRDLVGCLISVIIPPLVCSVILTSSLRTTFPFRTSPPQQQQRRHRHPVERAGGAGRACKSSKRVVLVEEHGGGGSHVGGHRGGGSEVGGHRVCGSDVGVHRCGGCDVGVHPGVGGDVVGNKDDARSKGGMRDASVGVVVVVNVSVGEVLVWMTRRGVLLSDCVGMLLVVVDNKGVCVLLERKVGCCVGGCCCSSRKKRITLLLKLRYLSNGTSNLHNLPINDLITIGVLRLSHRKLKIVVTTNKSRYYDVTTTTEDGCGGPSTGRRAAIPASQLIRYMCNYYNNPCSRGPRGLSTTTTTPCFILFQPHQRIAAVVRATPATYSYLLLLLYRVHMSARL